MNKYITKVELAKRWLCCQANLTHYVNKGLLTPVRIKKRVKYLMVEVLKAEAYRNRKKVVTKPTLLQRIRSFFNL